MKLLFQPPLYFKTMKQFKILFDPPLFKCEHYYSVTHGGDCCSYDGTDCNGLCYILFDGEPLLYNYLKDKIDNNDKVWAIQHLQSNDKRTKMIATYIFNR